MAEETLAEAVQAVEATVEETLVAMAVVETPAEVEAVEIHRHQVIQVQTPEEMVETPEEIMVVMVATEIVQTHLI